MWKSNTKTDLIIEVWEALDCESVGAKEIIEIEKAVLQKFGRAAVDSPMSIARLLADEGAELRHSEIMELFVERFEQSDKNSLPRTRLDFSDLHAARDSIRKLESDRKKLSNNKDGPRLLRERALAAKQDALDITGNANYSTTKRAVNKEIAEWLTIWLQTPEMFESWLSLRIASPDFKAKFGEL